MIKTALVLALAAPAAAHAVTVEPCDQRAAALAIMEPWEENTATFSNGNVRIAVLDNIEPAGAPFHILLLTPPYDELGARQCRVVSMDGQTGFASVWFTDLTGAYDPAKGLTLTMPVTLPSAEGGLGETGQLDLLVDQSSGQIDATYTPGGEE